MLKENTNVILILYFTVIVAIFFNIFIVPIYQIDAGLFIQLTIWLLIFAMSFLVKDKHVNYKGIKEKTKTLLIIIFIYYILYSLLGLVLGFEKNPYSIEVEEIIKNIVFILGIGLLQEFVRNKIIKNSNSPFNYGFIILFFTLLSISYTNIEVHFRDIQSIFQFLVSTVFVQIIHNALLTYLCTIGGRRLNFAYKIPITLAIIILPVFPKIDWFVQASLFILLDLIIFLFMNYEHHIYKRVRKVIKNANPIATIPIILVALVFVVFVAGFFPYRPVAIVSDSMKPTFSRGDVVISKKIENKDNIQVGDVVEYVYDGKLVMHRVTNIQQGMLGELMYTTKGDNNQSEDAEPVQEVQIVGIVKYTIPYVGYPTILFKELTE